MDLSGYISLCDAFVLLMKPLVEVVIHDLKTNTICYVNGNLSKRKVGDFSLLDDLETGLNKIVYPKLNFDGRLVKSISVPIRDTHLICINCDVSVFSQMQSLSEQFLAIHPKPESLFKNDWQEKLHISVHNFLEQKSWSFDHLKGLQKKELIKHLFDLGAFNEKNAPDYVAKILSMGRATIFNYLKQWRTK